MERVYCPYTDKYIDIEHSSREHIIPLALGGADGFEIQVDKDFNKKVGSQIDGKLAEDFLIKLNRVRLNVKGHSGKNPAFVAKNATKEGKAERIRLELERTKGIELWDSRESKPIEFDSRVQFSVVTDIRDLRLVRLRFVAKAALSAGYFVYQDAFQKSIKHDDLRLIMNFDGDFGDPKIKGMSAKVDVQFSDSKNIILEAFRYVTKVVGDSSCIGLVPLREDIAFFVGILGEYVGMIQVPCNKADLPNDAINKLGTFVCIQDGRPVTCSWERLITRIGEYLKERKAT